MKSTDLIQPSYVEGIPECSETCPSHDGKRCKIQGCRPGLLCRPAVAEMAARVTELERLLFVFATSKCGCSVKLSQRLGAHYTADPTYHEDGCIVGEAQRVLAGQKQAIISELEELRSRIAKLEDACEEANARAAYLVGDVTMAEARVTELEGAITRILAEEDPDGRRVRYDEARETLAGQKEEKI